jgi:hypothetical protein
VNQKPTDLGIPNRFNLKSSRFSSRHSGAGRRAEPGISRHDFWIPGSR